MRCTPVLVILTALTLAGAASTAAQDSTATRSRAARTPHRTTNRDDCLNCHRAGNPEQVMAVPDEHDYPNERCLRCHRAAETMPPQSEHAFDERHTGCLECHVAGNTVEARPAPTGHDRYTPAKCVMCHEPQAAGQ